MFVVVAGSLRALLSCVRVGAFVRAHLMLTLIWTVGSHFFSLIREVSQNEIRMQIFVKLGLRTHESSEEPANRRVVLQTEN